MLITKQSTATETKTSNELKTSFYLCYFAITLTHSTCTKTANYSGTGLVGDVWRSTEARIWSFHVVVLQEDGKEMYQNLNTRAERLFLLIKPIVLGVVVTVVVVVA